jgi:hypothetical protein
VVGSAVVGLEIEFSGRDGRGDLSSVRRAVKQDRELAIGSDHISYVSVALDKESRLTTPRAS